RRGRPVGVLAARHRRAAPLFRRSVVHARLPLRVLTGATNTIQGTSMHSINRRAMRIALVSVCAWLAQACSSGSGPSDVGNNVNRTPIARLLIVNSGATNVVREGAEVLLTGRDSEDPDGPLLDWTWSGPAGVPLVTRSRTTVSFTAPDVDVETALEFDLTV